MGAMHGIPQIDAAPPGIQAPSKDAWLPVTVYQFAYFDRASGCMLHADDFATESAIREIGLIPRMATAMAVDPDRISRAGILMRN